MSAIPVRVQRAAVGIFGVVVSVASILIVASSVDLNETARVLADASIPPIVAGLAVFIVGIGARIMIWRFLLPSRVDGSRVSAGRLTPVLMVGYLGNTILPARLGEVLRAYLISRREGVPIGGALGSIALERIVDIATLACGAFIAALGVGATGWLLQGTGLLAAGGVVGLVALATVGLRPFLDLFAKIVGHGPLRAPVAVVVRIFDPFVHWSGGSHRRGAIVASIILSAFAWLTNAAMYALVAQAVGVEFTPAGALLVTAISVLATAIPAAPAYVGTFELAAVTVAGSLGVAAAPALASAVLAHVIGLVPTIVGGPISLAWLGVDLKRLSADAKDDRANRASMATSR